MVAEILDRLRARHGACGIAAYADLSADMVLVASAARPTPREVLDALCARAAAVLGAAPVAGCDAAVTAGPDGALGVFLRQAEGDALLCLCDPEVELAAFLADARACLARLAQPEGVAP
ncbi:hypothetical protein [Jannaschia rubra]|uniref:Roadblock/LC7 domain protein n=1 Tax=Jannaschia rubra TaxID=282197 RepID=A0A0M6XT37_9RHOB|nr:hypothetical protein [Jannaschia rubra]CTQ33154.1 hypothetical protein JAN5088_01934 [Jannaschia rubra]SFG79694.1 hypothetical protein SAMN04488517_11617 [Jannaschia rubra]